MSEHYTNLYHALVFLALLAGHSSAQSAAPAYEVYFTYPAQVGDECPAFAKTSDGSAISDRLVSLVDSAQSTVAVAAYHCDPAPLASVLRRAQMRGLRLRVDTQHPSPSYFYLAVNDRGLMHHESSCLARVFHDENSLVPTGNAPLAQVGYDATWQGHCELAGEGKCRTQLIHNSQMLTLEAFSVYPDLRTGELTLPWSASAPRLQDYHTTDALERTVQLGQVPPGQTELGLDPGGLAARSYFTRVGDQRAWSPSLPILLH